MKIPPFVENLATWISIASLPSLVVIYVGWIKTRGWRRSIILCIAIPVAIASYTLDVADRLGWIDLANRGDIIDGWGVAENGAFYVRVNSFPLLKYKENFKLMLILEVEYANIDRMTDAGIEKSELFTITGGMINIAIPVQLPSTRLRLANPPDTKLGDQYKRTVDFNVVIIPNDLSGEQIRSLSDVQRFGGKIVRTPSTVCTERVIG
jgi:hypothetical protein